MSKAFTKEDAEGGVEPLPDRAISPHPNLVTAEGLRLIERTLAALERERSEAQTADEPDLLARINRDLRYWLARRASAEPMPAPQDRGKVHFGSSVTIVRFDGRRQTWRIVGEDEADPKQGSLSYVSPLARALLGRGLGDEVRVAGSAAEIIHIE
jgi:transcription elongation GreA/GreB family factor